MEKAFIILSTENSVVHTNINCGFPEAIAMIAAAIKNISSLSEISVEDIIEVLCNTEYPKTDTEPCKIPDLSYLESGENNG